VEGLARGQAGCDRHGSLSAGGWRDLASFSRLERRLAILLLGRASDPPAQLAVTAAEAYVCVDHACDTCRMLAQWFWENTDMSAHEVVAWLQTCYDIWHCW
jgi:hypothetical protein